MKIFIGSYRGLDVQPAACQLRRLLNALLSFANEYTAVGSGWYFRTVRTSGAATATADDMLGLIGEASATISTGDRFMGAPIDTFTYSGGELRNYDVTALVNTALLTSSSSAWGDSV